MRGQASFLLLPAAVATPSAAGAQTWELTEITIVARHAAGTRYN